MTTLVQNACDRRTAQCGADAACVDTLTSAAKFEGLVGCATDYQAVLACMASASWACDTTDLVDGLGLFACESGPFLDCQPNNSWDGLACSYSVDLKSGTVSATCTGTTCTCTNGSHKGTTFTATCADSTAFYATVIQTCQ